MASSPKTRVDFWEAKFTQNMDRDRRNVDALHEAGWRVLTVWECEVKRSGALRDRLAECFAIATDGPPLATGPR